MAAAADEERAMLCVRCWELEQTKAISVKNIDLAVWMFQGLPLNVFVGFIALFLSLLL